MNSHADAGSSREPAPRTAKAAASRGEIRWMVAVMCVILTTSQSHGEEMTTTQPPVRTTVTVSLGEGPNAKAVEVRGEWWPQGLRLEAIKAGDGARLCDTDGRYVQQAAHAVTLEALEALYTKSSGPYLDVTRENRREWWARLRGQPELTRRLTTLDYWVTYYGAIEWTDDSGKHRAVASQPGEPRDGAGMLVPFTWEDQAWLRDVTLDDHPFCLILRRGEWQKLGSPFNQRHPMPHVISPAEIVRQARLTEKYTVVRRLGDLFKAGDADGMRALFTPDFHRNETMDAKAFVDELLALKTKAGEGLSFFEVNWGPVKELAPDRIQACAWVQAGVRVDNKFTDWDVWAEIEMVKSVTGDQWLLAKWRDLSKDEIKAIKPQ